MKTTNPNISPEGTFTLTYFPYAENAEPRTPLEEAIQCLFDCLPKTEEEILQNIQRYHLQYRPLTRKKKHQLKTVINNVLQPACEEGNQDAIYWMYYAYDNGIGVEMDGEKALDYLKILAEYGYPDMQLELGKWYFYNNGEKMNRKAIEWFTKAAKQGEVDAMCWLGEYYGGSFRGRHNDRKAFLWYKKAAEKGHEEAAWHLGLYYQRGIWVKKNLDLAAEWYDKAGMHDKATRLRNGEDEYAKDDPFSFTWEEMDELIPFPFLSEMDMDNPF